MKKNTIDRIKLILLLFFLLLIYICACMFSYVNAVCSNISDNVFRLHVIANSDSDEDQELKYIVRNSILEYMNTFLSETNSKEDVILLVSEYSQKLEELAEEVIIQNGYNYSVNISVGTFAFPTKQYGDIVLPSGYYDALRVEIGEAKGQNWWCVMFPPLCFVDTTSGIVPDESKEIMQENLGVEEYSLISESSGSMEIKFKIVEVLQNLTISGIFM